MPRYTGQMGTGAAVDDGDALTPSSGGVRSAIETKAQEDNIRAKAATGGVITNDDLHGYLGHLANDSVLAQGHNTGHKPKGKATDTGNAKRGFRKLPGTGVNQIGHARYGEASTGLTTKAERKAQAAMPSFGPMKPEPLAKPDVKMSADHHKESVAFHTDHFGDHAKGAEKAAKRGDARGMEFHSTHMRDHASEVRRHKDGLKERKKQLRGKRK